MGEYDDDEVEDEGDVEGTSDEEDEGNGGEMEQLEKEYMELHKQEQ